jgi:hypothetical protein
VLPAIRRLSNRDASNEQSSLWANRQQGASLHGSAADSDLTLLHIGCIAMKTLIPFDSAGLQASVDAQVRPFFFGGIRALTSVGCCPFSHILLRVIRSLEARRGLVRVQVARATILTVTAGYM